MATRTRPCQRCGREIPTERIDVLPETRLCLTCSQESGGEFEIMMDD
ncbi:MAG TPA: TraR/DksA C4-type zinc finger protein [Tepidisphaeraceae bacterium]|jgi:RNA polymerase-binding transcription factor DksA|nr:TraR/DksA C4-type zinc finger protein [Tepidisphaeraceae bacterium]